MYFSCNFLTTAIFLPDRVVWVNRLFQLFTQFYVDPFSTPCPGGPHGYQEPLLPLCLHSVKNNFMLTESDHQHAWHRAGPARVKSHPKAYPFLTSLPPSLSIISSLFSWPDQAFSLSRQSSVRTGRIQSQRSAAACTPPLRIPTAHREICSKDSEFSSHLVQKFRQGYINNCRIIVVLVVGKPSTLLFSLRESQTIS